MKRVLTLVLVLIVGGLLLRSAGVFDRDTENTDTQTPSETIAQEQTDTTTTPEEENTEETTDETPAEEETTSSENTPTEEEQSSEEGSAENQPPATEEETSEPATEPETTETVTEDTTPEAEVRPEETQEETSTVEEETPENVETVVVPAPVVPACPVVYTDIPNLRADDNVRVYLYEWEIDILNSVVGEGLIQFEVINTGARSHRFGIVGVYDFGKVRPGETRYFAIELDNGEFTLYSPLAVDQERGMVENILVTE